MSDPIRIFTDGACSPNPGDMGIGVVVEWQIGNPLIISEYAGEGTNNIAEYGALIRALTAIRDEDIRVVQLLSDSMLMVSQVKKIRPDIVPNKKITKWACNDEQLITQLFLVDKRIKFLENLGISIKLDYIPRELNVADKPAKDGCKKKGA